MVAVYSRDDGDKTTTIHDGSDEHKHKHTGVGSVARSSCKGPTVGQRALTTLEKTIVFTWNLALNYIRGRYTTNWGHATGHPRSYSNDDDHGKECYYCCSAVL